VDPVSLALADFDGDGNLDLAVGVTRASVSLGDFDGISLLLSDGAGHFVATDRPIPLGTFFQAQVADFNQDGLPDLVCLSLGGDTVTVLLNGSRG